MRMRKYHGLGNDYLIMLPGDDMQELSIENIKLLCSQHYGACSDGVLTGPFMPGSFDFQDIAQKSGCGDCSQCLCALRIWNPDGSEAEKSGNGLRIFTRFLYDEGFVKLGEPFSMLTLGGIVTATVLDAEDRIRVDMGKVRFACRDFPAVPENRTTMQIQVNGEKLEYLAASVGNPHCIVLNTDASQETALKYGSAIENAEIFPYRINVQFLKVLGPHDIFINIWERGAGYTLASGSSASAAASVAKKLGFCESPITVHMPGGELMVEIDADWNIVQTGPVRAVYEMKWLGEL